MGDRQKLLEEKNKLTAEYLNELKDMQKSGAAPEARRDLWKNIQEKLKSVELQHGDDLTKLNSGGAIKIAGGNAANQIDNSIQPILSSGLGQKLAKMAGKAAPFAKKAALVLGGPAALALGTAQDVMASDDVGLGSDQVDPYQNEEALMNIPHENFSDPAVAEQARRWQKIRGIMP